MAAHLTGALGVVAGAGGCFDVYSGLRAALSLLHGGVRVQLATLDEDELSVNDSHRSQVRFDKSRCQPAR